MKTKVLTSFTVFAIIPITIFSMIFPLAVLSFSALDLDTGKIKIPHTFPENSSEQLIDNMFSQIPSNGSHPIGD